MYQKSSSPLLLSQGLWELNSVVQINDRSYILVKIGKLITLDILCGVTGSCDYLKETDEMKLISFEIDKNIYPAVDYVRLAEKECK